jgi:hypothetical protein
VLAAGVERGDPASALATVQMLKDMAAAFEGTYLPTLPTHSTKYLRLEFG